MILQRRVSLDGVQLDQVDSRILIQGIETQAGKDQLKTTGQATGSGSRVTEKRRESLDIVVRFTINEKSYRPGERAEVLEKVNRWAMNGGLLQVNYKEGRQVRVILAQAPGEGDAASRGQYQITFRACGVPYWEDTTGTIVRAQNSSSGTLMIGVNGSAETVLDVTFKNTSGSTINAFSVSAGGNEIELTGLSLSNGSTLTIDHDENGLIRIRKGNSSQLSKRSAASADDLFVKPGNTAVAYSAGGAGTITVTCKGRYL